MNAASSRQVAWITGASSGIGAELASALAARGWRIAISARSRYRLDDVAASAPPGIITPFVVDVTDRAALQGTWADINVQLGAPDLVILNAGSWQLDSAHAIDAAVVTSTFNVNLMGCINAMEVVAPAMLGRGRGDVVVVASVAGFSGLPGAAAYCASKAALQAWCEAMQPELAEGGVHLMVANPGFVDTPMTGDNDFPMPFMISASSAAAAILRGLDRRKASIAFPLPMAVASRLLSILPTGIRLAIKRRMIRKMTSSYRIHT